MQTRAMTPLGSKLRCLGPVLCALALLALDFGDRPGRSVAAAEAAATELPSPEGPAILTVTGSIGTTNSDAAAVFDRRMLKALGVTTLETTTAWDEGTVRFEGVPLRELLDAVGAMGETIHALALNGYYVDIPLDDAIIYDVLLAMKMNGSELSLRDKGPIWIVYPVSDHPELDRTEIYGRWIWQLQSLEIR